ncbi:hypothetical protein V8C40DRAFT_109283 [Trichoderma camerunense]
MHTCNSIGVDFVKTASVGLAAAYFLSLTLSTWFYLFACIYFFLFSFFIFLPCPLLLAPCPFPLFFLCFFLRHFPTYPRHCQWLPSTLSPCSTLCPSLSSSSPELSPYPRFSPLPRVTRASSACPRRTNAPLSTRARRLAHLSAVCRLLQRDWA